LVRSRDKNEEGTASRTPTTSAAEPKLPIEEKSDLRWTQMKVYFPPARAKKLIRDWTFGARAGISSTV
jgi:hypothetical protein